VLFDLELGCELGFGECPLNVALLELHFLVVFESGGEFAEVFSESVIFESQFVNVFPITFDMVDDRFVP
jgi:hypothetical protein